MFDFIVCDDDKTTTSRVTEVIKMVSRRLDCKSRVTIYADYNKEFKNFVATNKKKVVYILDIEMPSESGITVARHIRNVDRNSIIIILTSHHETADAIYKGRLNILTFISKHDKVDYYLDLAIEDAISYLNEEDELLMISEPNNSISIPYRDMLYVVKDGRKTLIKTASNDFYVYLSLDKLINMLPPYFKQSHRACIINMKRVVNISLSDKIIYFDNGSFIDYVGDKYKKELVP